ncbi:MAG: ATP synthase F1 subunit epsilon [Chloroherpetonaceae bacterium]|nr:ATP synthase F1 subunit epsilon [Chloroherpetonaceae bacterium]MDW8436565.1 ATP synthase F1 subunit epsilon [Chloroherpetonaceae bacterium]
MAAEFHLDIVTPEKNVFSGNVVSVTAPGSAGTFQVLADHAPFLSSLVAGEARIDFADKSQRTYKISGGFFEVNANRAMLLVESAS